MTKFLFSHKQCESLAEHGNDYFFDSKDMNGPCHKQEIILDFIHVKNGKFGFVMNLRDL
jgi:hypothetical protein